MGDHTCMGVPRCLECGALADGEEDREFGRIIHFEGIREAVEPQQEPYDWCDQMWRERPDDMRRAVIRYQEISTGSPLDRLLCALRWTAWAITTAVWAATIWFTAVQVVIPVLTWIGNGWSE